MGGLTRNLKILFLFLVIAVLNACGGSGGGSSGASQPTVGVSVLSSSPDYVTGTTALVRITPPDGVTISNLKVALNGSDVTGKFQADPNKVGSYLGLVDGIVVGSNNINATIGSDTTLVAGATSITAYPVTGPMISGPQQTPFTCTTNLFAYLPDQATLLSNSNDCYVPSRVDYVYRTTGGSYKTLPVGSTTYPSDLSSTLVNGKKYIVRLETGTVNRSIYQMAIPHDPLADKSPSAFLASASWNKKLIYSFGGGCQAGYYTQGTQNSNNINVLNDTLLAAGYANISSTLNAANNNCNDLLSAETAMMVKELFVKNYGQPMFTIGTGNSGGAYQSLSVAENYPGLFDGVVATHTFADPVTNYMVLHDDRLLDTYFNSSSSIASTFTAAQKNAVTGHFNTDLMTILSDRPSGTGANGGVTTSSANRLDPARSSPIGCNRATVNSLTNCIASNATGAASAFYPVGNNNRLSQFDPTNNLIGVRTNVFDHNFNLLGKRAVDGYAQRYLDNVGVQYGLAAFNAGKITFDQFVDLNSNIGGVDINFVKQSARTKADDGALARVYQSGRVITGANGLSQIPIITRAGYNDISATTSTTAGKQATVTHSKIWVFALRQRLINANGNADNQIILASTNTPTGANDPTIPAMDAWLTAISADSSTDAVSKKIARNKPSTLVDSCWDKSGNQIIETLTPFGNGQCNQAATFGVTITDPGTGANPTAVAATGSNLTTGGPTYSQPIYVAGAPISLDIFKCQLKSVTQADYTATLTSTQLATLSSVFPEGVCDWSKPGVGQVKKSTAWASIGPSPINLIFDITKQ